MRVMQSQGDFRAKAIAGTHTVLVALDCKEERRKGLLGFAFKRESAGDTPAKQSGCARRRCFVRSCPIPAPSATPRIRRSPSAITPPSTRSRASYGAITRRSPTPVTSSRSFPCTASPARSSRSPGSSSKFAPRRSSRTATASGSIAAPLPARRSHESSRTGPRPRTRSMIPTMSKRAGCRAACSTPV